MLNPKENPWLYPELIQSAEGLHLFARQALSSFMAGVHSSRRVGADQEFSQYRSYQPGDDLRRLDWKVYARSGRLYIKEADVQTRVSVRFVLDASASMQHTYGHWSKFDYARALIALMALMCRQQNDEFGLYAANEQLVRQQLPLQDKAYIHRFFHVLSQLKPAARWVEEMPFFPQQPNQNEIVVFLTDMYQQKEELTQAVKRLKRGKNELIVFQLMAPNELQPEREKGAVALQDLETGEILFLESDKDKQRSAESMQEFIRQTKKSLLAAGVNPVLINTAEPPHEALRSFVKKRQSVR